MYKVYTDLCAVITARQTNDPTTQVVCSGGSRIQIFSRVGVGSEIKRTSLVVIYRERNHDLKERLFDTIVCCALTLPKYTWHKFAKTKKICVKPRSMYQLKEDHDAT